MSEVFNAPGTKTAPSSWQRTYLGHLVDVRSGATPSKDEPSFWDGEIPWVSPKDMKVLRIADSEDHVSESALSASALRWIAEGSVLMVTRGMILDHTVPIALAERPLTINQDMKALVPRGDLRGDFLMWMPVGLNPAILARVEEAAHGTKALRTEQWRKLPLAIPPEDVQRRIADFLDGKTASIDALIAKQEQLLALLTEKRQGLITQAVTKGLDPNAPTKDSGVDWAGPLPAHWKALQVKRFARAGLRTFTDGDWIEAPYVTDHGVRLLQTGNVGTGFFKEQGGRFVSDATFDELRCTLLEPGDVMICRLDGPVGRACIAPDLGVRMITSVDNAILKVGPDQDARYIVYALSCPRYLEWVQALCRVGGGFRFRISRSMLGDFALPAPPREEQRQIADYLDRAVAASRSAEERVRAYIDKLREYRQALITAAVTGQLDVASGAPKVRTAIRDAEAQSA